MIAGLLLLAGWLLAALAVAVFLGGLIRCVNGDDREP